MHPLLYQTRRHFLRDCGIGLGAMALSHLEASAQPAPVNPMAPRPPHFPARAKAVIYLFMAGGPSQLELFDWKPKLKELHGKEIPEEFIKGKRFAFMDSFTKNPPKLLGTVRKFAQYGQSGTWVSECMPHLTKVVDDIAVVRSMNTDIINHAPAKLFTLTGSQQFGRPSVGAWATYGLGSESKNLPGFVVLQSGPRGPRGGAPLWGSGFLPTAYQGVPFRSGKEPILNLSSPRGVDGDRQREVLEALGDLNRLRLEETQDPEIATRIAQYEMAFQMQASAPELIDLKKEDTKTLALYGVDPNRPSFAMNCLLARRMVERGVRFIHLFHTSWDHHGGSSETLGTHLDEVCKDVDQACAALVTDLKARGLLDSTLVIWGGEFGRTPMGEIRDTVGRNHHVHGYSSWLAGGGVKPGLNFGATDELGFNAVDDRVHVHDLNATILHLLGLEHTKLTYRFQGRDFRLTDVHGEVVTKLLK
jgi:hypothetical protein